MADEEQVPKPGHFLPGGAGDNAPAPTPGDPRTTLTPLATVNRQQLGLGKPRPVLGPVDPSLTKATPLPTDPAYSGGFGAPPPAPLPGAPVMPLRGTRQTGGARPVGWHSTSTRTGVPQFSAEPPDLKQPRRFSNPIVAVFAALVLIAIAGGAVASYKLINSFDSTVENPLARPSLRPSEAPQPAPPEPTVTVTAPTVPDVVRLRKNKLYVVGKLPPVSCSEPKVKLTNSANVLRFYQAMLPCLNETWEPLVLKAGYPFRPPKLELVSKKASPCLGKSDLSFYCGMNETISMDGQQDLKDYRQDPITTRVRMMATLAHEYGHHVQMLTNILISSASREGWAKTKAEKLEWSRRKELQANCLSAVFLGANKKSLGIRGEKLRFWEWLEKHSGDEYNPKKIRDHGSRKSNWAWVGPAFKSANPASCNTYTASSAKVS
jgi:predicted metalloprotease